MYYYSLMITHRMHNGHVELLWGKLIGTRLASWQVITSLQLLSVH